MRDVEARRFIALRQRERRAWNVEFRIARQCADQRARERRFACPEIALKAERISGLQKKRDLVGQPGDVDFGQIAVLE